MNYLASSVFNSSKTKLNVSNDSPNSRYYLCCIEFNFYDNVVCEIFSEMCKLTDIFSCHFPKNAGNFVI
ncbi:hypothetical protein QQG55_50660 [Brugia pahangi]